MFNCDKCIHKTFFQMSEYEYVSYCDDFNEELEKIHKDFKQCPANFTSKDELKSQVIKNIEKLEVKIR